MAINVRGKKYSIVKEEYTPKLVQRTQELIEKNQKLSAANVAFLAIEFDLPMKTTFEFLESARILPIGTWEKVSYGRSVAELRESASDG
jgi:hypothetical protein